MATVLFVDDEENILRSLERGLIDEDYECIFVNSGEKALKVLEEQPISVIVSDMRMPNMDGLELLKIVKEKWPKTVRIVLSGYAQLTQVLATVNQADIFRFILKPWKMESEFMGIIQSALDYNKLQEERDFFEESLKKQNKAYVNMMKQMQKYTDNAKRDFEKRDSILSFSFDTIFERFAADTTIDNNRKRMKAMYYILHAVSDISFNDTEQKPISVFWKEVQKIINSNSTESNIEGEISTNFKLLYTLINTVLDLLNSKDSNKPINALCNKETSNGKQMVSLLLYIPTLLSPDDISMKEYLDSYIDTLNPIIDYIMKYIKGSFECTLVQSDVVATFKIPI